MVSGRQPDLRIDLAADGAHRPVAHHGEPRTYVHAGQITRVGIALAIRALIHQPHAGDAAVFDQRLGDRSAGPHLHGAGGHQTRTHPLHELAHGKHQPAAFVQEFGRVRQFDGVVFVAEQPAQQADSLVGHAQGERTPRRAHRVEQIEHTLAGNRRRHGNFGRVQVRERRANRAAARDDAGNAEADVVGALVTKHLQRHARHDGAFNGRRAVFVQQHRRKRGQEAGRGGAEAHAHDVDVHALPFDGLVAHAG